VIQNPESRIRRRKSGQALVPVLFIVLILTAFAVTVSTTARRETRSAANYLRETQQHYIARGAINYALAMLQESTQGGITPPQIATPPDTDANGWTQLGDGWFKLEIIDTASCVNINTADLLQLSALISSESGVAASIVDWRDPDDRPTVIEGDAGGAGAETDYYQSLNPPYAAKNAPFDTVEELLLVRGVTPAILYGASGVNVSTLEEDPDSERPLVDMLTTYSKELNVASDGTPRVNIKTASREDLQSKLGLSAQLAQRLIENRGQNGESLNSIADLLNIPGFDRRLMQQIGDKITVTDGEYRNGVVNINTAPAAVLATIPDVEEETVAAVIQARQGGTTFRGLNDLFQITSLNREQLQTLVDHVCTKSSVYLVRVKVRMAGSGKVYAAQALVELAAPPQEGQQTGGATGSPAAQQSTEPPPTARILQWREVPRTPGWSMWSSGVLE